MEKTHFLNILYGIFLLLISIGPVIILIWGIRIIRSFVNKLSQDIANTLSNISDSLSVIKQKFEKAKNDILKAKDTLQNLENSISDFDKAINQIEKFAGKISSLTTESIKLLNEFSLPLTSAMTFVSDFVSFKLGELSFKIPVIDKHVDLGKILPNGLNLKAPYKISDLDLNSIDKSLQIPGLNDVEKAFEDITSLSTDVINSFEKSLTPFNDIQSIGQDVSDAVKEIGSTSKAIKNIEDQVTLLAKIIATLTLGFGKKIKPLLIFTGILLIGIYLNWVIPNIISAFSYIKGETSIITLSGQQ